MTSSEIILTLTIWGLLGCGLFFSFRAFRRKRKERRPSDRD